MRNEYIPDKICSHTSQKGGQKDTRRSLGVNKDNPPTKEEAVQPGPRLTRSDTFPP